MSTPDRVVRFTPGALSGPLPEGRQAVSVRGSSSPAREWTPETTVPFSKTGS
jgi:hypothetical protein